MIKTVIKVILIATFLIGFIMTIPSLFEPIADIIDSVFSIELTSFMNNVYAVIPSDLMNLITAGFSVLAITIFLSWLMGAKK